MVLESVMALRSHEDVGSLAYLSAIRVRPNLPNVRYHVPRKTIDSKIIKERFTMRCHNRNCDKKARWVTIKHASVEAIQEYWCPIHVPVTDPAVIIIESYKRKGWIY